LATSWEQAQISNYTLEKSPKKRDPRLCKRLYRKTSPKSLKISELGNTGDESVHIYLNGSVFLVKTKKKLIKCVNNMQCICVTFYDTRLGTVYELSMFYLSTVSSRMNYR